MNWESRVEWIIQISFLSKIISSRKIVFSIDFFVPWIEFYPKQEFFNRNKKLAVLFISSSLFFLERWERQRSTQVSKLTRSQYKFSTLYFASPTYLWRIMNDICIFTSTVEENPPIFITMKLSTRTIDYCTISEPPTQFCKKIL